MDITGCTVFGYKFSVPIFTLYEDRLASFSLWPKQMSPDKQSLAAAGLFYGGAGDIVKCFACGIRLSQWSITDSAFVEHKKYSPDCVYLNMIGYGVCPIVDEDFPC
ncbi:MAG: baculoviral IAP repeat-containing protein [Sedimenticola sp.]